VDLPVRQRRDRALMPRSPDAACQQGWLEDLLARPQVQRTGRLPHLMEGEPRRRRRAPKEISEQGGAPPA